MASYVAALALKQTRADLPARVRLVFGCNEESGFKCVKRYFQTEEAPTFGIAPDSDWPCIHAEKGIANLHIEAPLPQGALTVTSVQGGSRPNVVIDKCEAVATVAPELRSFARERMGEYWDRNVKAEMDDAGTIALVAFGKAAHGAMPFAGDSAFVRVWRLLADLAPPEEAEKCQGFVMFGHPSGVGLGIHGRDDVTEDLTSNIGVVRSERGVLHATVNVRYPVKWSGEELKQRCERFLADKRPGWRLASMDDSPGLYFPLNSEPVLSVVEAYREETGDNREPGVMGGGTYARAVPRTVSVGGGWEGDGPAHENDERIKVEHLIKLARIYANMLYRLAHAAAKSG
ncbi:MAG: hypothetical protein C4340_05820 [Armatimonadota bacterium]